MRHERVVGVSYRADGDFERANLDVLGGEADVVFLHGMAQPRQREVLARARALIGWQLRRELPAGSLDQAPSLRLVQLLSAGADGVDFSEIPDRLVVAGNVGAYAKPMAEHVLAMVLSLAKRLPQRHAALAAGRFGNRGFSLTLDGAVCAILGFGGTGAATAALMRAFGARIHAVNRTGTVPPGTADWAGTLADLDTALAAADVCVICLPLTHATRGLIGARELALMKPAAIVVNVARGAIVDEAALYEHLRAHPDFCAGIDAWWDEPAPGGHFSPRYPFLSLPNVIGSPHNSGVVAGTLLHAARMAAENVRRYLRGEPVTGVVQRGEYLPAR
jgi:phosphoglycerate dehydrogenase-like enzyme